MLVEAVNVEAGVLPGQREAGLAAEHVAAQPLRGLDMDGSVDSNSE